MKVDFTHHYVCREMNLLADDLEWISVLQEYCDGQTKSWKIQANIVYSEAKFSIKNYKQLNIIIFFTEISLSKAEGLKGRRNAPIGPCRQYMKRLPLVAWRVFL